MNNTPTFDIEKERADFERQMQEHRKFQEETDKYIAEQEVRMKELESTILKNAVSDAGNKLIHAYNVLKLTDTINATIVPDEDTSVKYELIFRKIVD